MKTGVLVLFLSLYSPCFGQEAQQDEVAELRGRLVEMERRLEALEAQVEILQSAYGKSISIEEEIMKGPLPEDDHVSP
jgi:hypothetical protein